MSPKHVLFVVKAEYKPTKQGKADIRIVLTCPVFSMKDIKRCKKCLEKNYTVDLRSGIRAPCSDRFRAYNFLSLPKETRAGTWS